MSIIIPTYNRPESLNTTLETISPQTYRNREVIIIDDGSQCNVTLHTNDRTVKLIRQKHAGPNAARNSGFARSRGEFLLFSDDDIEFSPLFLERTVRALQDNADKAYAYCAFEMDGKIMAMDSFDAERLRRENYISGISLIRRSMFPSFDPAIKRLMDWDLWLTMLDKGHTGVHVPEVLFKTTIMNHPRISDDSTPGGWTYAIAYRAVAEKHRLTKRTQNG